MALLTLTMIYSVFLLSTAAMAAQLLPAAELLGATFSIPSLDVLAPPEAQQLLLPAIQFTFNQSKQITSPTGVTYAIPDQLEFVTDSSGSCSAISVVQQAALNFSEAFALSESIASSGFLDLYQASASWTVGEALGFQASEGGVLGAAMCSFVVGKVQLYPLFELTPSPEFVDAVNHFLVPFPSYSKQGIPNFVQFFSNWGLGQPTSLYIGGTAGAVFASNQVILQQYGQAWIQAQASMEIGWFTSQGGGSVNGGAQEASSIFVENTKFVSFWRGGLCEPGTAGCSFGAWSNSLIDHPQILSFGGVPTSQVIALVNESLVPAANDAIGNLSTIAMLNAILIPLTSTLNAMAAQTTLGNVSVCFTPTEACADSGYGSLVCCDPVVTGPAIPNATEFAAIQKSVNSIASIANEAASKLAVYTAESLISVDQALELIAILPTLSQYVSQGMMTTSCFLGYHNQVPPCPANGQQSWSPGANTFWCNYPGGDKYFENLPTEGCNGPQSCQSQCPFCRDNPGPCLGGGYRCVLPNWCPHGTARVSSVEQAQWPVAAMK